MINRRVQSGFTLIEIVIVISVLAVLSAFILPAAFAQLQQAKVEGSIEQASNIASQCNIARRKPLSSVRNADFSVVHTYASLPNWSPISALEALLSADHRIRGINTFGKPFLVRFDERNCYVAVDLDFSEPGIFGQQTEEVGGVTRIIVSSGHRATVSTEWTRYQKRAFFNETSR